MFGFIGTLYDTLLYQPLFNALVFIYNYLPGHDFGISIIILTVLIRVLLYPTSVKALHSQKALQKLQPQIKEIQHRLKNDKEAQAKETLELYRKEKINPFSGLLLIIAQFPILIALYQVFFGGLEPEALDRLYSFVANPGQINAMFLGMVNLGEANVWFAILAGIIQFYQTKMLLPKEEKGKKKESDMTVIIQKQMLYVFPVITIVILFKLPSALGLYWIISGAFSIAQQYYILKRPSAA